MDCEKAADLLSAMLDGECEAAERSALEAHLASCPTCRATREEIESMDRKLRRSFAPRIESASRLAERVISELGSAPLAPPRRWPGSRFIPLILSAAAGFLLAVFLFGTGPRAPKPVDQGPQVARMNPPAPPAPPAPPEPKEPPVASLTVASGAIEYRKPGGAAWEPLPSGAPIAAGTRIRTGPKDRCEFRTAGGSEVRLNGDTEVVFLADRKLEIAAGQLWSSVARAPGPYEINMPIAAARLTALDSQFDLRCEKQEAVLTVEEGNTRVAGNGDEQVVAVGERVKISDGKIEKSPVHDMVLATSWVNAVLVLKGRDNQELGRRLDDLFAELGEAKMSYLYEKEIIGLGDYSIMPLVRFIQSDRPKDRQQRVNAARLLGKIAQPWTIPYLVELLGHADGDVRYYAAKALEKLTRETLGIEAEKWRDLPADSRKAIQAKWQAWWEGNKGRFPGPE